MSLKSSGVSSPQPTAPESIDTPLNKSRMSIVIDASPQRIKQLESAVTSDVSPQVKRQKTADYNHSPHRISSHHAPRPSLPLPQRPASSAKPQAVPPKPPPPTGTSTPGRGRPKGWRPGMSYAQMRGRTPPPPGSRPSRPGKPKPGEQTIPKRRGRPPKPPSPPPRAIYRGQNATFIAFLCEWSECKAELHNLETLRRHVDIVHLEECDDYEDWVCLWGKCAERDPAVGFDGLEKLGAHMREKHLEPFAWHVGDGPANTSGRQKRRGNSDQRGGDDDDDGVPAYLKDTEGNQVTPSIKDQEVEDYLTWRENRKKLKQLLLERDRNLPSEESDELEEEDVA